MANDIYEEIAVSIAAELIAVRKNRNLHAFKTCQCFCCQPSQKLAMGFALDITAQWLFPYGSRGYRRAGI